jgi:quinol monooxygenase YgiN
VAYSPNSPLKTVAKTTSKIYSAARANGGRRGATVAWFAVRTDRTHFAIFDAFRDDAGRDAHLGGPIASALMDNADRLLAEAPTICKVDLLAYLED